MTKTLTPPLKWHGGKHDLAKWIIGLMPPRCLKPNAPDPGDPGWLHYVEPYFGGGSVLLANDPEGISEVLNDLNARLANFWTVLRSGIWFSVFKRLAEATPFSEGEFNDAEANADDPEKGPEAACRSRSTSDWRTGPAGSFYLTTWAAGPVLTVLRGDKDDRTATTQAPQVEARPVGTLLPRVREAVPPRGRRLPTRRLLHPRRLRQAVRPPVPRTRDHSMTQQYFRGPNRRHFRARLGPGWCLELWWDAEGSDRIYIFQSCPNRYELLPCPLPLIDAFEQDDACPAEPILDYLLEANPTLDWLHECVAQMSQQVTSPHAPPAPSAT